MFVNFCAFSKVSETIVCNKVQSGPYRIADDVQAAI